jgi:hypothetical protein
VAEPGAGRVLGLAEVMDILAVLAGELTCWRKSARLG